MYLRYNIINLQRTMILSRNYFKSNRKLLNISFIITRKLSSFIRPNYLSQSALNFYGKTLLVRHLPIYFISVRFYPSPNQIPKANPVFKSSRFNNHMRPFPPAKTSNNSSSRLLSRQKSYSQSHQNGAWSLSTKSLQSLKDKTNTQTPLSKNKKEPNTVPKPPAQPNYKLKKAEPTNPLTPEMLINGKKQLKSVATGQNYQTTIHPKSLSKDFSSSDIISELYKRGLAKPDVSHTTSTVTLSNNQNYLLGASQHNVKLTPHGHCYSKLLEPVIPNIPFTTVPHILPSTNSLGLVVGKINNNLCLIETGDQKHLMVAFRKGSHYFSPGYLTSFKNGDPICEMQFKFFQQTKENKTQQIPFNNKSQYFIEFDNIKNIPVNQAQEIRWSKEYLLFTNKIKDLASLYQDETRYPIIPYNPNGISKLDGLNICKIFDYFVSNGKKHPQTYHDKVNEKNNNKFLPSNHNTHETIKD